MKQYFREHYIRFIFIISLAIGVYYSSRIPGLQYFLVYFYVFIVVDLFPENNFTNKIIPIIKLPGYIFLYITPLFKSFYQYHFNILDNVCCKLWNCKVCSQFS